MCEHKKMKLWHKWHIVENVMEIIQCVLKMHKIFHVYMNF
jgi:hypothetical protein